MRNNRRVASASNLPVPAPTQPRAKSAFPWSRFLTGVVVIGSLMGLGWSFTQNHADDAHELPVAIESLSPEPGSPVVPAQSTVSADLQFGFEQILLVDGVEIPLDQLDTITAQGIVSFTPGEGQEIRRFAGGEHVATVVYWPVNSTREKDAHQFSWHFSVN